MRSFLILLLLAATACGGPANDPRYQEAVVTDTLMQSDSGAAFRDSMPPDGTMVNDTPLHTEAYKGTVDTKGVAPAQLLAFAQTLIGTPYVYGSTDPKVGFDCSGFITHVFNHFGISVPRSSVDFTGVGQTVDTLAARPGDLILFTGTNPLERNVGHMGIVVDRGPAGLRFIHSTSGKAMGVTITPFNDYYKGRFVRVARVF
ncbi:MAG: NlpC/P60 family protein [Chitinophagaceae bacterium]|nr:MAG: NlpC/P60 family protein [Chitinophagaceae bacterium]